ncbi:MAG: cupin domain-containing protein [Vulcanimicrobiaceae bacterium]
MNEAFHIALAAALQSSPSPGSLAADMAKLEGLDLEFYAPRVTDPQKPHTRDELYIIARGSGVFHVEEREFTFAPGDVLYVPAYAKHRFTTFGEDFATWVMFFGPEREPNDV